MTQAQVAVFEGGDAQLIHPVIGREVEVARAAQRGWTEDMIRDAYRSKDFMFKCYAAANGAPGADPTLLENDAEGKRRIAAFWAGLFSSTTVSTEAARQDYHDAFVAGYGPLVLAGQIASEDPLYLDACSKGRDTGDFTAVDALVQRWAMNITLLVGHYGDEQCLSPEMLDEVLAFQAARGF